MPQQPALTQTFTDSNKQEWTLEDYCQYIRNTFRVLTDRTIKRLGLTCYDKPVLDLYVPIERLCNAHLHSLALDFESSVELERDAFKNHAIRSKLPHITGTQGFKQDLQELKQTRSTLASLTTRLANKKHDTSSQVKEDVKKIYTWLNKRTKEVEALEVQVLKPRRIALRMAMEGNGTVEQLEAYYMANPNSATSIEGKCSKFNPRQAKRFSSPIDRA